MSRAIVCQASCTECAAFVWFQRRQRSTATSRSVKFVCFILIVCSILASKSSGSSATASQILASYASELQQQQQQQQESWQRPLNDQQLSQLSKRDSGLETSRPFANQSSETEQRDDDISLMVLISAFCEQHPDDCNSVYRNINFTDCTVVASASSAQVHVICTPFSLNSGDAQKPAATDKQIELRQNGQQQQQQPDDDLLAEPDLDLREARWRGTGGQRGLKSLIELVLSELGESGARQGAKVSEADGWLMATLEPVQMERNLGQQRGADLAACSEPDQCGGANNDDDSDGQDSARLHVGRSQVARQFARLQAAWPQARQQHQLQTRAWHQRAQPAKRSNKYRLDYEQVEGYPQVQLRERQQAAMLDGLVPVAAASATGCTHHLHRAGTPAASADDRPVAPDSAGTARLRQRAADSALVALGSSGLTPLGAPDSIVLGRKPREQPLEPGSPLLARMHTGSPADDSLKCLKKVYRMPATKEDPATGDKCVGEIEAVICYGGCHSGEIADWLFPHRKSIHRVCRHGKRIRKQVRLDDCSSPDVDDSLRIYHYVDAVDCVCKKCNSADTTCLGTMSQPTLPNMSEYTGVVDEPERAA